MLLALKRYYKLTRRNFFPHFLFSLVCISVPLPKFSCRQSNNSLHHWQCLLLLYCLKSSRKCRFTCQCPLNGFFLPFIWVAPSASCHRPFNGWYMFIKLGASVIKWLLICSHMLIMLLVIMANGPSFVQFL